MVVRFIVYLTSATLIFRGTDISKCFRESLGIQDNESQLYWFFLVEKSHLSGAITVHQLGFEGRGVLGRALFVSSYKNEGTLCHVMCLVSRYVTK